jgi:hypothetical protein
MPARAAAERTPEPPRNAASRAAPAGGMAATVLGLQRTAGNLAVQRLLARRPTPAARTLARCGSGGCSCGGTCRGREDEELEEAGSAALRGAVAARRLQRTLKVSKPADNIPNPTGKGVVQTNGATVKQYLDMLCGPGSATVDAKTGVVALKADFCTMPPLPKGSAGPPFQSPAQTSATPVGCGCLCDMIGSAHPWTIVVDDASWPHTRFDDNKGAETPGTGTGGTVTAPSPNSTKLWGAGTVSGSTLDIDAWLVLGHELCGHGWLGDRGEHAPDHAQPRGEGGHQETVKRENRIRAEHKIELRGGFKDPNCGESYWRDKAKPATVNWSSYRDVCIKWREAYNKKHGTSYKITDRIP